MSFCELSKTLHRLHVPIDSEMFEQLDTLRLVANVAKHGEGAALEDLKKKEPKLFLHLFPEFPDIASADDLLLSERRFVEFGSAVLAFWNAAPEYWDVKSAT